MARVTLERVRKVYADSGFVAVHGLDLDVGDGELVVLVGPSGCGKSTTLRMIAGLESISSGQLSIGGRAVNDLPPKERDVAMVFQGYALYPHMTVFENMAFALVLRKRPRAEIETRVRRAADMLGLTPVLERRPRQLSGGQRQRVAIGRAIVREPRVFLFDEPLSNLDAQLRLEMRREIAALHRRLGATMIYVTHDQIEAMTLGDRIVVLDAGRVQQIDPPLALYHRPRNRFVASFIGSPPMNLIDGVLAQGADAYSIAFRTPDGAVEVPLASLGAPPAAPPAALLGAWIGRRVTLGLRPEHLTIVATEAAGRPSLHGTLDAVEPLGYEIIARVTLAQQSLTVRTTSVALPALGTPVTVAVDAARAHIFDGESGAALELIAREPEAPGTVSYSE